MANGMAIIKELVGEEGTALRILTGPRGYYVELVDVEFSRVLFVKIAATLEAAEAIFEELK